MFKFISWTNLKTTFKWWFQNTFFVKYLQRNYWVDLSCLIYNIKQNKAFKLHITEIHRIYMGTSKKEKEHTQNLKQIVTTAFFGDSQRPKSTHVVFDGWMVK